METGNVIDRHRNPQKRTLTRVHERFIDKALRENDELTAHKLKEMLISRWPELKAVSVANIKRCRKRLGWVVTRPRYCQLIREGNKRKRLEWCIQCIINKEDFDDVIFSDESTVALERHGRITFRRWNEPRKLKSKAKHPVKIHVWGAISKEGASRLVLFTGIMNAPRYTQILKRGLLPLLKKFPITHRFQQDNDPKHKSKFAQKYFKRNGIKWWKTPAESPDLNPIENVWGSMKTYLRTEYKPKNLQDLKDGILQFWKRMTPGVCQKYISHLHKVIPKVIEVNGEPSGY